MDRPRLRLGDFERALGMPGTCRESVSAAPSPAARKPGGVKLIQLGKVAAAVTYGDDMPAVPLGAVSLVSGAIKDGDAAASLFSPVRS